MQSEILEKYKAIGKKGKIRIVHTLPTQIKTVIHKYIDVPLLMSQFKDGAPETHVSGGLTFGKPLCNCLWTSTLLSDGRSSWMKHPDVGSGDMAIVLAMRKKANILEISDKLDLMEVWKRYGYGKINGSNQKDFGIDWRTISKDFDAVHFAYKDWYPLGVDVESVCWFKTDSLRMLAITPVKFDDKNEEYFPLTVPVEWRSKHKDFPEDKYKEYFGRVFFPFLDDIPTEWRSRK